MNPRQHLSLFLLGIRIIFIFYFFYRTKNIFSDDPGKGTFLFYVRSVRNNVQSRIHLKKKNPGQFY